MNIDNGTLIGIAAAVVAGIGSTVAAVLTVHYGNKTARNDKQVAALKDSVAHAYDQVRSLKRELRNVYAQIAAYHAMEAIAVAELARLSGRSTVSVMNELRTSTEGEGLERPTMTRRHAESMIKFWE